ncbi:MAG TPA: tRNA adenosine(34) deaminase TadA [Candidatus Deferrimicrobiaceae bacterium]
MNDRERWMRVALAEAEKAAAAGEVPVGAVVVGPSGEIVARDRNRVIASNDPTAHAEILALRKASRKLGNYRLSGCRLVVTLEPCPMCAGAAVHARVKEILFGAIDPKAGAALTLFRIPSDERLNHRALVIPGVLAKESAALLTEFFRRRR